MTHPRELARAHDPETSHEAARYMVETGRLGEQQTQTLEAVERWPARTANELGHLCSQDVHRRLPELETKGKVRREGPRTCDITGRRAATWVAHDGEPVRVPRMTTIELSWSRSAARWCRRLFPARSHFGAAIRRALASRHSTKIVITIPTGEPRE